MKINYHQPDLNTQQALIFYFHIQGLLVPLMADLSQGQKQTSTLRCIFLPGPNVTFHGRSQSLQVWNIIPFINQKLSFEPRQRKFKNHFTVPPTPCHVVPFSNHFHGYLFNPLMLNTRCNITMRSKAKK